MSAYTKTAAPHITSARSVPEIYWGQYACLFPLLLVSFFVVGIDTLRVFSITLLCAFLTEWIAGLLFGRAPSFRDGSNALSALVFALILPLHTPWWLIALSLFVAIFFGREVFGGLETNFLSISLLAGLFVFLALPGFGGADELAWRQGFLFQTLDSIHGKVTQNFSVVWASFVGGWHGSLGSTSGLLILAMGIAMILKKYVRAEIPLLYLLTVSLFGLIEGRNPFSEMLSSEILFTAFFLLADSVVMPSTKNGKRLFAIVVAIGVSFFRTKGSYYEAVCGVFLVVNLFTPWIETWIRPRATYGRSQA